MRKRSNSRQHEPELWSSSRWEQTAAEGSCVVTLGNILIMWDAAGLLALMFRGRGGSFSFQTRCFSHVYMTLIQVEHHQQICVHPVNVCRDKHFHYHIQLLHSRFTLSPLFAPFFHLHQLLRGTSDSSAAKCSQTRRPTVSTDAKQEVNSAYVF